LAVHLPLDVRKILGLVRGDVDRDVPSLPVAELDHFTGAGLALHAAHHVGLVQLRHGLRST
jgi:hypothetical protein